MLNKLKKFTFKYGTFIFFVILIIFFSLTTDTFLHLQNITNILRQISIIGICTVGMTMIILTGGIDLSIGSIVALSGIVLSKMIVSGISIPLAIVATLLVGILLGFINGILINKVKIPPLIATLGTISVYRGIAYIITGGIAIYGFPDSFRIIGQGYLGFMPIPVIIQLIVYFFGIYILYKTPLGRYIYGIGSSEKVSYLSGINVSKVKYFVYMLSGFLGSLAGIVLLSRLNSGLPNTATGFELDVVTAVVLGGISITGGEGRLEKSILGCLIIGVLSNGMILLGIPEFYQMLTKGLVLILAVGIDITMKRSMD
ncbi:MAG: ABC transporter permease [Peptoniphilaceae bacterium]